MKYNKILIGLFFVLGVDTFSPSELLSKNVNVHVFGDSHANYLFKNNISSMHPISFVFNGVNALVTINWMGARTMHGIGIEGLKRLNLKNFNVLEGETAVFVFGEIDIRWHVIKQQKKKNRSLQNILQTLVQNYIDVINQNRAQYKRINCVIVSIVPPRFEATKDLEANRSQPPTYGSLKERINATKQLNSMLNKACALNNIKFLDIYNIYSKDDGSLNPALSDNDVHVGTSHNTPVKEKLTALLVE